MPLNVIKMLTFSLCCMKKITHFSYTDMCTPWFKIHAVFSYTINPVNLGGRDPDCFNAKL